MRFEDGVGGVLGTAGAPALPGLGAAPQALNAGNSIPLAVFPFFSAFAFNTDNDGCENRRQRKSEHDDEYAVSPITPNADSGKSDRYKGGENYQRANLKLQRSWCA